MDAPPPPPPPHGDNPHTTDGEYRKSSDLPPGNYDIFIVPPHSSGGGFLYLPSLQCHRNSFLAGAASTLLVVLLWAAVAPTVKTWYMASVSNGPGGMGMTVVALGLGVAGWAIGMSQSDKSKGDGGNNGNGGGGSRFGGGFSGGAGHNSNGQSSGANYNNGSNFGGNGSGHQQQRSGNFGGGQNYGNQYAGNQHGSEPPPNTEDTGKEKEKEDPKKAEWEREREEAKRKEELRRKMEEFKRKRDAEAKEKERKRERDAMEKELKERREQLEREMAAAREKAEKEARDRMEKEAAEARAKQEKATAEAKAEADRLAAEAKEKAAKEAAEKEAAAKEKAQKEAMAKFAALKEAASKRYAEKKAQEAKGQATQQPASPASAASAPRTPSPKKQPPFPTAKTTIEDDAYSFRPYDRPRRPYGKASGSGSAYSESSYAPSQSTARTTPPPSHRSAYSTQDPDKIVIQGVYQFNNAFMKTPVAQLVSGQGMVSDGLVLRMTTEGLFVDDDLRGIGQREWDVKAWTLKLAEVWCPQLGQPNTQPSKSGSSNPFSFRRGAAHSMPTNEESDAFTANLLKVCKNTCRLASPSACFARSAASSGGGPVQPPQAEFRGLHILRASIRDQEGRKYVFVLQDTEAWKLAIGLQRLRGGALVRALGVSALPVPECKSMLGGLGYI